MRYRRFGYRYAMLMRSGPTGPFDDLLQTDRVRLLVESCWRPDADTYETPDTVEIVIDLSGVHEEDFEVQLFDNALVVEGRRRLSAPEEVTTFHAVRIRQGPFRLELPLVAPVDSERVHARYDLGLLRITLPKRGAADR
jgi:HSP20 family molecular chaperone IbpA